MEDIIKCTNGVCDHPEHAANALVWVVPAIAIGYLITTKIYKKYFK